MAHKYEANTNSQGNAVIEFYNVAERLKKLYNTKLILKNMYKEVCFFDSNKWIFEYELESEE